MKSNNLSAEKRKASVMNGVISPDNIKRIGELVTLYSLRTVCHYEKKTFSSLYKSLLRDMFRSADPENLYSDAYDIVQTVICFLCEHIGESMHDVYKTDTNGKPVTLQTRLSA